MTTHIQAATPGAKPNSVYHSPPEKPDHFIGLADKTSQFDLLLLVKKAGKQAGFTPKMIQLLEYYLMFTRDIDWGRGGKPIVYQSQIKTAMDMGVSERQIQKLETALHEAGALTWHRSGNGKRYGQRCKKSGAVVYAYGVDLRPLATLQNRLKDIIAEKHLYQAQWLELKRQISYYRAQIRDAMSQSDSESYKEDYGAISYQIRQNLDVTALQHLLQAHKDLLHTIKEKSLKGTCRNEEKFVHKENTIDLKPNKLESKHCSPAAAPPVKSLSGEDKVKSEKTGLDHIQPKHLYFSAREEFRDHIPIMPRQISWDDIITAAHTYKTHIKIDQHLWGRGCQALTRVGAAICVILTDQAMHREKNPVQNGAAYFQSLITKAGQGELKLHNSIFGLLQRTENISH